MHQGGRAAQHFDPLGQQRLGHHGVVGADGGGIVQLHAIGQHAYARPVHAANHRARGSGTKVGGLDARLTRQALAQGSPPAQLPHLTLQHAHRRGHVVGSQRQTGNGHFRQGGGWGGLLRLGT